MRIFTIEHSQAAYRADFVLYGLAIVGLAAFLGVAAPLGHGVDIVAFTLLGLGSWTAVEYALHRFVLHGLQPFADWHAQHHARPTALICTPTLLSSALVALLIFLPVMLMGDLWRACSLTLGVLTGYLGYAVAHHAIHHSRSRSAWLRERKRWHARHHHEAGAPGCYGVTTSFWDRVFSSVSRPPGPRDVRTPRSTRFKRPRVVGPITTEKNSQPVILTGETQ